MRISQRKFVFSNLGSIGQEKCLARNKDTSKTRSKSSGHLWGDPPINSQTVNTAFGEMSCSLHSSGRNCLCALHLSLSPRENPPWAFIPPLTPLLCFSQLIKRETNGNQKKVASYPNSQFPNPNNKKCWGSGREQRARFGGGGRRRQRWLETAA